MPARTREWGHQNGKSRLPWLSGTATWSYYAATHAILGVQPDYAGLRFSPCLPSRWPEVTIQRVFRNKRFSIHIKNGGKTLGKLTCNGKAYPGGFVPVEDFKEENRVEIEMS